MFLPESEKESLLTENLRLELFGRLPYEVLNAAMERVYSRGAGLLGTDSLLSWLFWLCEPSGAEGCDGYDCYVVRQLPTNACCSDYC